MNPYQPPAQYPSPQNGYPVLPQDPQSKYPQLPPVNTHQNVPPQYPHYPQQQPQIPYGNHPGYIPPSQPALVVSDARIHLKKEIQDIETLFKKGFCCYEFWLILMIFFGVLMTGYFTLGIWFSLFFLRRSYSSAAYCLFAAIFGIFLIIQCLSSRKAMDKKDLVEAKKALNSTYWVAFFYLLVFIGFLFNDSNGYLPEQNLLVVYLMPFIVVYIIPMWIHIAGARKVRDLLEKRDALALELDTRYTNNA